MSEIPYHQIPYHQIDINFRCRFCQETAAQLSDWIKFIDFCPCCGDKYCTKCWPKFHPIYEILTSAGGGIPFKINRRGPCLFGTEIKEEK